MDHLGKKDFDPSEEGNKIFNASDIDARVKCSQCNGTGRDIVDMGGPDVEVNCHNCNGSKLEPPRKQLR